MRTGSPVTAVVIEEILNETRPRQLAHASRSMRSPYSCRPLLRRDARQPVLALISQQRCSPRAARHHLGQQVALALFRSAHVGEDQVHHIAVHFPPRSSRTGGMRMPS